MARLRWTDAMIARLLQLRVSELRAQFDAARRHPQLLAVAWTTLRLRFRAWLQTPGAQLNVLQLKNKWFCLRKEFAEVRAAEAAARAAQLVGQTAPAVEYPSYWQALVAALGSYDSLSPVSARTSPSRRRRTDKPPRMKWTKTMTAALLEMRLVDMQEQFRCSSAKQREAWERLGERFESQTGRSLDAQQLKGKFTALRQEYARVVRARRAFDRHEQIEEGPDASHALRPPVVPRLWPMLENYFSGRLEVLDDEDAGSEQGELHGDAEVGEEVAVASNIGVANDVQRNEGDAAMQGDSMLAPTDVSELQPVLRLKWNNEMAATLLALRSSGELRTAFATERSSAQLKLLWESLRVQFCRAHDIAVDAIQLKNKYNSLRREYLDLTEHPDVDRPPYWDALVVCFGAAQSTVQTSERGSSAVLMEQSTSDRPPQPGSRRQRLVVSNPGRASTAESEDNSNDRIGSLMKLLELQGQRQQEMQEIMRRQAAQLEAVIAQTATVNRAVLQLLEHFSSELVNRNSADQNNSSAQE